MRHEWLITSAECVDAKRRRRQQSGGKPPEPKTPSPGFSGEHTLPEDEQTREPQPSEREQRDEQPVGFPQ